MIHSYGKNWPNSVCNQYVKRTENVWRKTWDKDGEANTGTEREV